MTRAGMKLRAGCMAFRIRWVEESERKRDEAIASRDEARELRGIAERARARESESVRQLDGQIAETERVLVHRGFPHPGGGEHLALAVDNALDTYAERLQTFAESVASNLGVDVAARADQRYPVRPGHELLEEVHQAYDIQRRYDALGPRLREGLGLHPMVTDDGLVQAAYERPFGHTRWQSEIIELVGGGGSDSELLTKLKRLVADGREAQRQNDELRHEQPARSRDGMTASCPACGVNQDLVVAEHTTSIEDGPGSENPPRTCSGSGIEAEHLPADVGGEPVDVSLACRLDVKVDVSCGDDDEHDGPCWPSPMSLAQRALNAAALNRPDLLSQMRQAWAVVGAAVSHERGPDPVTELSQVRDALYAAGHPAIRGGFHPGKTVEAVEALVRQHDGTLRDAAVAEQARRAAYDPAMGGDIEPPPGRAAPGYTPRAVLTFDGVQPVDAEETRDDTVRRLAREIIATRAVLAPDVDTTGTPLDTLARASIDSNRTLAVAAELRWWSWGRIVRATELLARATDLDPGYAPAPDQAHYRPDAPPRPDVWAAARELSDEVPF